MGTHQNVTQIDDRPTMTRVHVRYGVDDDLAGEDEDGVDEPGACEGRGNLGRGGRGCIISALPFLSGLLCLFSMLMCALKPVPACFGQ